MIKYPVTLHDDFSRILTTTQQADADHYKIGHPVELAHDCHNTFFALVASTTQSKTPRVRVTKWCEALSFSLPWGRPSGGF